MAQSQARLFSPILRYSGTFVQQEPAFIYAHLVFIVFVGILWPLQVRRLFHLQLSLRQVHIQHTLHLSRSSIVTKRDTWEFCFHHSPAI